MHRNTPKMPPAWYSAERRKEVRLKVGAVLVATFVLLVGIPWIWGEWHYRRLEEKNQAQHDAARELSRQESAARRVVHVTERYDLSWPAREGAPTLKMSLPVLEMGAWRHYEHPKIQDTLRGPATMELVMPVPDLARLAVLTMHREPVTPGPGQYYERIPICATSLLFRGRYVQVALDRVSECGSDFGKETKAAVAQQAGMYLEKLALESLTPPSVDMQLERLRAMESLCTARYRAMRAGRDVVVASSGTKRHSELLCDYVLALGDTLLEQAPLQASELMLGALVAAVGNHRSNRWDYFYLEHILAALGRAGETEGSLAITVHALRASQRNDNKKPEIARAKAESLEALFRLSPKLAAGDPLQELVDRSIPWFMDMDAPLRPRRFEVTKRWHEKAVALDPSSALALRTRFRLCMSMIHVPEERKGLAKCADEFLALWRERVAAGRIDIDLSDVGPGMDEGNMAISLMQMWYSYSFGARDFAGGLQGLGRVREFMQQRFPKQQHGFLYAELKKYEEIVANGPTTIPQGAGKPR